VVCFCIQGGRAGAIYLYNGATAEFQDSAFQGNIADRGSAGAVQLATVGQLTMQGVTMKANEVRWQLAVGQPEA
jgi:hypothetical protein